MKICRKFLEKEGKNIQNDAYKDRAARFRLLKLIPKCAKIISVIVKVFGTRGRPVPGIRRSEEGADRFRRKGDPMIEETIRAVKEAEAQADKIVADAKAQAEEIVRSAQDAAEAKKAEAKALAAKRGEDARRDAGEEAGSQLAASAQQAEQEAERIRETASSKESAAVDSVIALLLS